MKLCVQLHLDRLKPEALAHLPALERVLSPGYLAHEDGALNLSVEAEDIRPYWRSLRRLLPKTGLDAAAIVVCSGQHEWDDYLLLHSFDPTEELDTLV